VKHLKISALLLAGALLAACDKKHDHEPAAKSSFNIHLDARVGTAPFALNTPYTKSDGQQFTATKFKYLVSNLTLTRADGSRYAVPESYYLVDAARPATATLEVKDVPAGEYTGLSFIVGVDAARNSSGAQTGALDPGNDMFWDWASGYIFLKMEGTSPQSPTSALVYHIAGVSSIRTVSPTFGTSRLVIGKEHAPEIHMLVHPAAMFESATPANRVNFATAFNVRDAGPESGKVADNYAAGMFTVAHIRAH
jgi:hypothetical protein